MLRTGQYAMLPASAFRAKVDIMRIFLAGASGAIGRPLIALLRQAGHHVTGATRQQAQAEALAALGCRPAIVDMLDARQVMAAVQAARPEIVIHQLTALHGKPPPSPEMLEANARIRRVATPLLVEAARAVGARRLIAQSIAWAYAPKPAAALPYREDDPLDLGATGARAVSVIGGVVPLEKAVLNAAPVEGVVLRYGQFYGPGTWSDKPGGPSSVHVEAAAHAALLAIDRGSPGLYNVAEPGGEVASDKAAALGWRADFRL